MRKFYNFTKLNETDAELNVYGDIVNGEKWVYDWLDMQCTDSVEFKKELDALGDVKNIKVFLNSNGGDPFAALNMYSMLKRHPATITVHIDGLAASAATIIVCAGDKVVAPAGAMMMFHNVKAGIMGYFKADELRELADGNEQIEKSIAEAYSAKSKLPEKQLAKLLDGENWRTAKECKELGFVDEVLYEQPVIIQNAGKYVIVNSIAHDLSHFAINPFSTPPGETDPPKPPTPTPEPTLLQKQQERFYTLRKKINT